MAGLGSESSTSAPISINQPRMPKKGRPKVLNMKESIDLALQILQDAKVVPTAATFIEEFERNGCTVDKKMLASYLSQTKDIFRYDREVGGWVLVNNGQARHLLTEELRI